MTLEKVNLETLGKHRNGRHLPQSFGNSGFVFVFILRITAHSFYREHSLMGVRETVYSDRAELMTQWAVGVKPTRPLAPKL